MNVYQDFFENMSAEEWEFFAIDFLAFEGFKILQSPSRGADAGLDGIVEYNNIKYLVSCKHYIKSNKSVGTSDENNIIDRLVQHEAKGFIGFYSTLPSSSLVIRLDSYKKQGYEILYFDKDRISDILPNIPSSILQKYGLANDIKYVMNIHDSEYQPLKCVECQNDILKDDYSIRTSMASLALNNEQELEYIYGHKNCIRKYTRDEDPWIEIDQALHQDQLITWNKLVKEYALNHNVSSNFYKNKNDFDTKIQQRMFPSNWGKHPLSLIK